mgnify:CR=1 FL=1
MLGPVQGMPVADAFMAVRFAVEVYLDIIGKKDGEMFP